MGAQEEDLKVVFAPFGHIIGISIAKDSSGRGPGTGTVQCAPRCLSPIITGCWVCYEYHILILSQEA